MYVYTHEVSGDHSGYQNGRVVSGCPRGQPRPVQAPYQEGPRDRPSSEEGYSERHSKEHRKAGRPQAEVSQYERAIGALSHAGKNNMQHYIALIHKEADSDYGVSFPDLPGVISAGSDLDEARAMAAEALALHLKGLAEDGEAIPSPSSLDEIMANKENNDGVAVLIPAPAASAKSVRVNITLPSDVLEQIDQHAELEGYTRSGFLAHAAKRAMVA